jgi:cyclic pyranopterin phosphate synthase
MPEEDYIFSPSERLMRAEEIEALAKVFVANGVDKIRLTGGEPLVRKDAADIMRRLSRLPVSLTLTTNGTRLHEFSDVLEECGIRSLNISLDTLDRERFRLLTRRDQYDVTMQNIRSCLSQGLHVKVNMVVMRGINHSELADFVEWTRDEDVHVRFIEFMPFTGNRWKSDKVFTMEDILKTIGARYPIERLGEGPNDTARRFQVPGHKGSFAVISTMSAPFCGTCNRMRLTADGKLKNCLFSQSETDLLSPFRKGEDILPLIRENIRAKAERLGGQFPDDFNRIEAEGIDNRSMIAIGG